MAAFRRWVVPSALAAAVLFSVVSVTRADSTYIEPDWTFNAGGGYSAPVGNLTNKISDGWNFTMGLGHKITDETSIELEYMSHHLGVQNSVLHQYSSLLGGAGTDGTTRVWSVSLSPKWDFHLKGPVGAYVIGGGGYYHVNAQITTPGVAYIPPYCDYYWGCWGGGVTGVDNIVAEHKDDTGGLNAGMGITVNLGSGGMQLYVESRYHYIFTHGADLQLLPMTVGFRW